MTISIKKLLYIISACIAMNFRFWGMNIPEAIKYSVLALWTLYFFANYYMGNKKTIVKKIVAVHYKLMFFPILVMEFYAITIWCFSKNEILFRNYTRLASTCLFLFLGWGFAASGFYLFKDKVVDYLFCGGVLSYLIGSLVCLIVTQSGSGLLLYLRTLTIGESTSANFIMEVHDLTFAMGIFFLFYVFFDKRKSKHKNYKIVISIVLILLGLKRIEILAIIISIFVYFLLLKWRKTIKIRATILAILFTIFGFGYVYLVDSGLLNIIASYFSLNTMGRLEYYNYAKQYCSFSPAFLGTGFTYFTRLWGELSFSGYRINGIVIAASIHSDLLVLYIENGFIMTLLWIFYCFNGKVLKLRRFFCDKVAECYLLLTVYMFVLYLTDNTFRYTGTQIAYFIVPLVLSYLYQDNRCESEKVIVK